MQSTSRDFKANARRALADANLQTAMGFVRTGFIDKRKAAADALPEFEALRDAARDIKDHTLARLDHYLARYETKAVERGAQVHWCVTAEEARNTILGICRSVEARTATKGKSMIAEEIGLNEFLEENGIAPIETDLGEYIIQLRKEPPSHIIAPAVHVTQGQVEADFRSHHTKLPADRPLAEPQQLVAEAREMLRRKYLEADVGITGANFLVAETGSSVIVTNEG